MDFNSEQILGGLGGPLGGLSMTSTTLETGWETTQKDLELEEYPQQAHQI